MAYGNLTVMWTHLRVNQGGEPNHFVLLVPRVLQSDLVGKKQHATEPTATDNDQSGGGAPSKARRLPVRRQRNAPAVGVDISTENRQPATVMVDKDHSAQPTAPATDNDQLSGGAPSKAGRQPV